jgi:hypothetical protein
MIISFKYKFIFIKTYKTAGSSIENYLYPYLNNNDILAPTEDHSGINCWGNFEIKELEDYFGKEFLDKKIKYKMKYFAHMPIWLVKERLEHLSNKLNYDIFKNFYKFGVIRNPFDMIVSHYYWQNSPNNKNSKPTTFKEILKTLESNTYPNYGLLTLNSLMDKNFEKVLCDKVIKYEDLNKELTSVFIKLGIPFDGKLKIFKKKSKRKKNYKDFYDSNSQKLITEIFWKDLDMFDYNF